MGSFSITFDPKSLNDMLDKLADGAAEQIRPAAQAGAQVLYEEVLRRVPVSSAPRKTKSGRVIQPGALKAAIYQVYSRDNSSGGKATYHVSWNYKKAPHGHLVEFGTRRAPAHPFLRPSYDAKKDAAVEAMKATYLAGMKEIIEESK